MIGEQKLTNDTELFRIFVKYCNSHPSYNYLSMPTIVQLYGYMMEFEPELWPKYCSEKIVKNLLKPFYGGCVLISFYRLLKNHNAYVNYRNNFRHNMLRIKPRNLISGAFGWPTNEAYRWYEIHKVWSKFIGYVP